MSVQEFYSAMTDLWDQFMESKELKACNAYIARTEEQRLVQFLMALRGDFEGLRGSVLHHSPLLPVNSIVSDLLVEKTRLKSHYEKGIISTLILLRWQYLLSCLLIIIIGPPQGLPSMSVAFVSRKVIGRFSVLS